MRRFNLPLLLALAAPAAVVAAESPAQPAAAGHVVKNPDWLRRPSLADFQRVWPFPARSAAARIHCGVTIEGLLENCVVVSETPPGVGAGEAALRLVPVFRMSPKTIDGKPVPGGEVTIPVHFDRGDGSARYLTHPVWIQAPTVEEVKAALDGVGPAVTADLSCVVRPAGGLQDCRVLSETPSTRETTHALLSLTGRFQLEVDPAQVNQPIKLQAPLAIAYQRQAGSAPYIARPEWLQRPAPSQALSVFPAQAAKAGLTTGRAVIDCAVSPDGALAGCRVVSEDPVGQGFAAAALSLAAYMKIAPWTQDGHAAVGARIQIPIRLNAETAPQPGRGG